MAQRNQQNRPQGADGLHRVPAKSFAAKFQDKRELYTFLSSDCGIYCPSIDTITVWHLRDMVDGKKGKVLVDQMRHLQVPHYEELTIEKVVEWARQHYSAFADRYFPIDRELFKFPRQFVINVVNTCVGLPFRTWVEEQINIRNERLLKATDFISMDPIVYNAYMKSQNVSRGQGASHHLMKVGAKRRRTKTQIEEDKEREQFEKEETQRKLEELAKLKAREQEAKEQAKDASFASQLVHTLVDKGDAVYDEERGFLVRGLNPEFDQIANEQLEQQRLQHQARQQRQMPDSFNQNIDVEGIDEDEEADGDELH